MHYTVINLNQTLFEFTKNVPDNRVSSGYVISEKEDDMNIPGGKVICVVDDAKRAWHAGNSNWRELEKLNDVSIGIEHVNKGFKEGTSPREWYTFDPDQIKASGILSRNIVEKYGIKPIYVVGHSDIAPLRKEDPGIMFPWGEFYKYGVGAWLSDDERSVKAIVEKYHPKEDLPQEVSILFLSTHFKNYGYKLTETATATDEFLSVLKAFKSHFSYNQQPEMYDSGADMNDMFWIWALTAKYESDVLHDNTIEEQIMVEA